jgi:hypothetical protein
MSIEVVVPEEYMEIILSDLNSRRGKIENMEHHAGSHVITGNVPLSEVVGYASRIRTSTLGRANLSMKFKRYEICPTKWFGNDEPYSGVASRKGPLPRGGQSGSVSSRPEVNRSISLVESKILRNGILSRYDSRPETSQAIYRKCDFSGTWHVAVRLGCAEQSEEEHRGRNHNPCIRHYGGSVHRWNCVRSMCDQVKP